MPRPRRGPTDVHPALAEPPLGFAHRGLTPRAPGRVHHAWENTVAAFESARACGIRHLETDVRATADGVCVLLHDPDLARTTDRSGLVTDLPWSRVAEARVAGEHPVPRLEDVLDRFPDCVLNLDCKDDASVAPLARAVVAAGAADRVVVASFDGRRSAEVARRAPGVARSVGAGGARLAWAATTLSWVVPPVARLLWRRLAARADALQLPERVGRLRLVTPRLVALAHEAGLQVHVWTVDDPADMQRLLGIGVDGLMSDRADVLAEVLADVGRD